jgi:4-amino-4-deoxy-L-arabinose transferase-like glycosyltransferase
LARLTSALFGAVTSIPVYLLGRRWWGETAGLLAALIFSLQFLAVRNSHYGVPDSLGAFFVVVSAYFATRLSPRGPAQHYALAGLAAGLAVAARPLAALIFLPALLFHLFGNDPIRHVSELRPRLLARNPAIYLGGSVLALVVGTPAVVAHPVAYAQMIRYQMSLGQLGGFGSFQVIDTSGWLFYLSTLRWGIGDVALGLALVGAAWIVVRPRSSPLFVFTFPILAFLYMGGTGHAFARYLLPVLPFLALAAAFSTMRLLAILNGPVLLRSSLGVVLVGGLLVQPARSVLEHDWLLTQTDTRTLAGEWIEANLPEGATIAREWFTPVLPDPQSSEATGEKRFQVQVTSVFGLSGDAHGTRAGTRYLEDYQADGVEYLVTSSFVSDTRMVRQEENARKQAFYEALDAGALLLREFKPYSGDAKPAFIFDDIYGPAAAEFELQRPGPVIKIYQVPSSR